MGCSQVVRQLFLVQCIVGSNPTIPASFSLLTTEQKTAADFDVTFVVYGRVALTVAVLTRKLGKYLSAR